MVFKFSVNRKKFILWKFLKCDKRKLILYKKEKKYGIFYLCVPFG